MLSALKVYYAQNYACIIGECLFPYNVKYFVAFVVLGKQQIFKMKHSENVTGSVKTRNICTNCTCLESGMFLGHCL